MRSLSTFTVHYRRTCIMPSVLYTCSLNLSHHAFLQNELRRENHEFYEILLSYLATRRHFLSAEQEVQVLQGDYTQFKEQSWITLKQSVPAKVSLQFVISHLIITLHLQQISQKQTQKIWNPHLFFLQIKGGCIPPNRAK